jgi:hypothetical protein
MIWLSILRIIARVVNALCCVGFVLGCFLWTKYETFANILVGIGIVAMMYGLTNMLIFAIFGK